MTCGKKARPLSVSRYSARPEPALAATVSSTPIWQKVRSRSETMVGGAPVITSMSVNRRAPRNAAARAAADQRLPISSMVCGTRPGPGEPPAERRRVVTHGTDRSKPPLGPNVPRTSEIPAGWPQARQCMTGANSSPHWRWYIGGSGSVCSVTQTASQDQIVSSTFHRPLPRSLSARDRAPAHVAGAEHDALGQVTVHVDRQRHEVRVVFSGPAHARGHADLAAEHARFELVALLAAGQRVVLDQAVEQEPAWLVGGSVSVPVGPSAESAVDGAELGAAVRQVLLAGRPGDQVHPPPVQPGLHGVLSQEAPHPALGAARPGRGGFGAALEEAVPDDLGAFVQHME